MTGRDIEPCTTARKEELRQEFITVMTRVDKLFKLCTAGCDYTGVVVKCDGQARRRKRETGSAIKIDFNIPVSKYVIK